MFQLSDSSPWRSFQTPAPNAQSRIPASSTVPALSDPAGWEKGKGQNTSALCTWRGLTTIPTLQKRCQKLPSHPSHHLGLDRKMGSVRSGAGIGTELVLAGPNLKVGDDPHREKCSLLCFFPLTCSFTFPPSIRGKIESWKPGVTLTKGCKISFVLRQNFPWIV